MTYLKNKIESYTIDGGINTKVSKYTTGPNYLLDLVNMNFKTLDSLVKRAGSSLYLGATVSGTITSLYEFTRLSGASYLIACANTNAYTVDGSFSAFKSGLSSGAIFDFVTFVDRLFMANGTDFFKFDGSQATNYSIPKGQSTNAFGVTGTYNASGGLSGVYLAGYGYFNDRGYFGPPSSGVTVTLDGASTNSLLYFGMTHYQGYGISGIRLYRSQAGFNSMFGTTSISLGSTFTDFSPISTQVQPPYIHETLAPKYLEIANNQLILAGFTGARSLVKWSDVGEPEGIRPESNAEVRTDDGDFITGLRAYNNGTIISKKKSLHHLAGDSPATMALQDISDEYGNLSNRCMLVFNDLLVLLDEKGFIQYNGANIDIISTEIEPIVNRINIDAAVENAWGIHYKSENQLWFGVPLDDSTTLNAIIVYDYVAGSWSTHEGVNPSSIIMARGNLGNNKNAPIFGTYTGQIGFFDDAIEGDFGQAITCSFKLPYRSNFGKSSTEQFRRFYLDVEPIPGSSQAINIDFLPNYGSTVAATFTVYQEPFQSRVDFGIPAKSLSARVYHSSATFSFQVYGWTIESRYQRST